MTNANNLTPVECFNKPEVTLGKVIGYANKNNCGQVLNFPQNIFAILKQAKLIC